ncbi:MAG: hypothetical protein H6Q90_4850 [Deltaproteobacteria bacterium]|nr:hypothetical protein [Deltaproteobacteria bacterium]
MSGRRLLVSLIVVLGLGVPASAEDAEQKVPADTPGTVQVSCDFIEITASSGKAVAVDPALKPLEKRLTKVFDKKWNDFKQLSRASSTLAKKKPEVLKLKQGTATATLVEIVDKSKVRLTVEFDDGKGKANQTQLVDAGDWVITVIQQPSGDGHLLAGSCK